MNSESTDPQGRLEHTVGRLHETVEAAIKDHCSGGDLWMVARIAADRIARNEIEPLLDVVQRLGVYLPDELQTEVDGVIATALGLPPNA